MNNLATPFERTLFEQSVTSNLLRSAEDAERYVDPTTQAMWSLWQTARATPRQEAPISAKAPSFQARVHPWLLACFGEAISADQEERNHRFLEEALELVQACGCTRSEAQQLVEYVYDREIGEKKQEVGGVMVTLAALCTAHDMGLDDCGEVELRRIWTKVEKIRAKQAAKPKHSPLPQHVTRKTGVADFGVHVAQMEESHQTTYWVTLENRALLGNSTFGDEAGRVTPFVTENKEHAEHEAKDWAVFLGAPALHCSCTLCKED